MKCQWPYYQTPVVHELCHDLESISWTFICTVYRRVQWEINAFHSRPNIFGESAEFSSNLRGLFASPDITYGAITLSQTSQLASTPSSTLITRRLHGRRWSPVR